MVISLGSLRLSSSSSSVMKGLKSYDSAEDSQKQGEPRVHTISIILPTVDSMHTNGY